jgi:hypothetical protein
MQTRRQLESAPITDTWSSSRPLPKKPRQTQEARSVHPVNFYLPSYSFASRVPPKTSDCPFRSTSPSLIRHQSHGTV